MGAGIPSAEVIRRFRIRGRWVQRREKAPCVFPGTGNHGGGEGRDGCGDSRKGYAADIPGKNKEEEEELQG